ncbi:DUF2281 domain-containing protein [Chryseobacterium suipulveris]
MESLLHQKISDKIKEIPEYLLEELSDFIDFLMIKKIKKTGQKTFRKIK